MIAARMFHDGYRGCAMLTERPAVFDDEHPFMFLQLDDAEMFREYLEQKRIQFRTLDGPGRTVKFNFTSLSAPEVERLLIELTRAVY
jgi:hypothetical protein